MMKFYSRMEPSKRRTMILKAVAHSSAMEGMSGALAQCLEEIEKIQKGGLVKVTAGKSRGVKKR